jgi:hypothetical protein
MLAGKAQAKPMTDVGKDGWDSAIEPDFTMTPSSLHYPPPRRTLSAELLSPAITLPSGMKLVDLKALVNAHWSQALSKWPQATCWQWCFGSISNRAPCTLKMENP